MSDEKGCREATIRHHPAECDYRCDDPLCPYPHFESWEVNGVHYDTEADARAALAAYRKD